MFMSRLDCKERLEGHGGTTKDEGSKEGKGKEATKKDKSSCGYSSGRTRVQDHFEAPLIIK